MGRMAIVCNTICMDLGAEMRKFVLVSTLAVISTGAMAEWVLAAKSDSTMFYVNPVSIKSAGDMRRAWILYNNNSPQNKAMSARTLMEFKCDEERYRPLALTSFSEKFAAGNVVHDAKPSELTEWQYIAPGEVMEQIATFICKRKL